MIGVTFSIHLDDTYSARYSALTRALEPFKPVESRTTSCVFLDTTASVKDVDLALYGALDWRKDKAIVFETFRHSMEFFGPG